MNTQYLYVEDVRSFVKALQAADGPVTASFTLSSCSDQSFFELLAAQKALQEFPHPSTVRILGVSSLVAAAGATNVVIEPGSYALVRPLEVTTTGTSDEIREQAALLEQCEASHRQALARWPRIQALLDDGQEHWLSAEEFAALTS